MDLKFSKSDLVFLFTGTVIFIYIFVKASVSSFTHDESITYLQFVPSAIFDILTFKSSNTNSHILNTLMMKFSEQLLGASEVALRLPNLLLFLVYMAYSYKLFKNSNQVLGVALFVLLVTNNAIVDFFGLARGYGLSFGFMLMSLYHFIQSFNDNKLKNTILFHCAALLAVMSNFTLLDYYVALLLVYNILKLIEIRIILRKKFRFFNANKLHAIPLLISVIILYLPVSRMIMNSSLDFGGKDGFYMDTVPYLIYYAFYGIKLSPVFYLISKIIFTGIVIIPFVIIIQKVISRNETFFNRYKGLLVSTLLLIFISIAIVLQHVIFKADYPKLRFSLFLFPLFIIHFGFLLSYLDDVFTKKYVPVIVVFLSLLSGINFALKADLYKCSEWEYDMETKNMLLRLDEFHSKNHPDSTKIKLGINWLFEPTINFYRQTRHIDWLLPADREGISQDDDYYYIFRDQLQQLNPDNYTIITEFNNKNMKTILLKNTNLTIH